MIRLPPPDLNRLDLALVDSTSSLARRLWASGELGRGWTAICARHQTEGRGTQGRRWESPADAGLYLTLAHTPMPLPLTPWVTIAVGLACVEALSEVCGLRVQLKPVNDLMVDGRKLGGILTEALTGHGEARPGALLVGIGINWLAVPRPLPDDRHQPTAVEDWVSLPGPPSVLVDPLATHVAAWVQKLGQEGEVCLHRPWHEAAEHSSLCPWGCAPRVHD